jgi:integrase
MGRTPTINRNLPPHMRARVRGDIVYYFYDTGGKPRKEISLGKNYIEAIKKWTELEGKNTKPLIYFKDVAERYAREIIPLKADRTQSDNIAELKNLLEFFNNPPAPVTEIKPMHVSQYLNWRTNNGKNSTTRANREKALLSHIFNKARAWGVIDTVNPCQGIKGFTEDGRDIYIEDNVFDALYTLSSQPLKDALDLAYLTGQRPGDTIAMSETDINVNELLVTQGKTNIKIRMSITGELKLVLERIAQRKLTSIIHTLQLICAENGRALSQGALRQRFVKTRKKAAKQNPSISIDLLNYQYRDLRAKAASDKAESGTIRDAQLQLGHSTMAMTEHYVRARRGQKVTPTR